MDPATTSISYNLIASLIAAATSRIFHFSTSVLRNPLRKALKDTEKKFKGVALPFPVSRIEAILKGSADNDRLKTLKNIQHIQSSQELAISLLDFEGGDLKDVAENVQVTKQVVEYFLQKVNQYALTDRKLYPQMIAELIIFNLQFEKQEHAELGDKIDRFKDDIISEIKLSAQAITESQKREFDKAIVDHHADSNFLLEKKIKKVTRIEESQMACIGTPFVERAFDPADEALNNEIDSYRELLKEQPKTALYCYERLKSKCWSNASSKIKFRITTNIGACHLMLGQTNQAVELFFAAEQYDSENPKALSNSALAYLLRNEKANARVKAKRAIEIDPDHKESYGLLLGTYSDDEIINSYQNLVPANQLESESVAYALGMAFLRKKNYASACDWLKIANDQISDYQSEQAYALCLLEWIFSDETAVIGGQINPELKDRLNDAKKLLEKCWNNSSNEIKSLLVPSGLNLSKLYRFLGKEQLADQVLDEVLSFAPEYQPALESAAISHAQNGRYEKAISFFEKLSFGEDAYIDLAYFETLVRDEQYGKANNLLESITASPDDPYLISVYNGLKLRIIEEIDGEQTAIDAVTSLIRQYPENVSLLIFAAKSLRRCGETDRAEQIVIDTADKLSSSHGHRERIQVADALFDFGKFAMALPIYKALMINFEFCHSLRRYLSCCMETNQRVAIEKAFSQMSVETFNHAEMRRFKGVYYYKTGQIEQAFQEIAWVAENFPGSLSDILNWLFMLNYQNDDAAIKKYLDSCSDFPDATPADRMRLVQYFDGYGYHERALKFGYNLCRAHSRNADVVLRYLGLIFLGMSKQAIKIPKTVELHTAVTVKDDSDEALKTFIIEEDHVSPILDIEVTLSHTLAKMLMGKRKGDLIERQNNFVRDSRWEIVNITSKYIYLGKKMADGFHDFFPENTSFRAVKNKIGEDGKPDLTHLFKVIDAKTERARRVYDVYRSASFLPIGFVAKALGVNPFQAWIGYLEDPGNTIKCCNGDLAERRTALESVIRYEGRCVIDPLTLYLAYTLGIHDCLKKGLGSIAITESVLQLYREQIASVDPEEPRMSLGKMGNQYTRQEFSKEYVQNMINYFQQIHDWAAANCEIIPAVGKQDIDPQFNDIAGIMHPCFFDIILAANGSDRFLLSDDLSLRSIGRDLLHCDGAWLQIAMHYCFAKGALSANKYFDSIISLLEWGINFTWIDSVMLIHFAEKADWQIDEKFTLAVGILGQKSTDTNSALQLAEALFFLLGKDPEGSLHVDKFVYAVLNGMRAWRSTDLVGHVSRFSDSFTNVFYRRLFLEAVKNWVRGHLFSRKISMAAPRGNLFLPQ